MAYVPPALRRQQQAADGEDSGRDAPRPGLMNTLPTIYDIQNHFWPRKEEVKQSSVGADASQTQAGEVGGDSTTDTIARLPKEDESNETQLSEGNLAISDRQNADNNISSYSVHPHSTLNGTQDDPDKLRYVLLFNDAHPRWKTEKVIYVKSDLRLLPNFPIELPTSTNDQSEVGLASQIMVFEQDSERNQFKARFTFLGYFNLMKMEILKPNTAELVRMMEQKWNRTNKWGKTRQIQRDSEAWKKSLSYTWAVLKFEKDENSTAELEPPKIEVNTRHVEGARDGKDAPGSQQGVSEMLKEMRLKDWQKGVSDDS